MIVLCTASDNYVSKYDFCIDSQNKYCQQNNYQYHLITGAKESRNWKRAKIYALKELLDNTNSDVLMIDCDCFITDKTPPLDSFLTDKSIYYANGISGRLNSGFVYFKNDHHSKKFVDDLIELLKSDVPMGKGFFVTRGGENGHMIWLQSIYQEQNQEIFCEISYQWNCSSPKLTSESYVLHFTNLMKKLFPKYKNENSRIS
jgi:hypothetical protein